jgi:hypothetical protein
MNKLNWKIIESNIAEAKEELENIEKQIQSSKKPNIAEFQISLQHAYHHLNFAWNAKYKKTKEYKEMTNKDFKKCGKYPKDIEKFDIE